MDADLRFRRINSWLAAITGRPVDALVGQRVEDVLSELGEQVIPHYRWILQTGESVQDVEMQGQPASDPYVKHTWLANHHPLRSETGDVEGIITVVLDITGLKCASRDLQETQQRLLEAQHLAGIGSWEWDLLTGEVWWSDELYRISGRDRWSFQPSFDALMEQVHPDDISLFRKQLDEAFERGHYEVEFRVVRLDGSVRTIRAHARLERTAEGVAARLSGTAQDVTSEIRRRQKRPRGPAGVRSASSARA